MVQTQRYWDGTGWTEHIAPGPSIVSPALVPPPAPRIGGLVVAGAIFSLLIPIVGFVIGIVLCTKRNGGVAGVMCLALSVVMFFVWADALTPEPTYNYYGY